MRYCCGFFGVSFEWLVVIGFWWEAWVRGLGAQLLVGLVGDWILVWNLGIGSGCGFGGWLVVMVMSFGDFVALHVFLMVYGCGWAWFWLNVCARACFAMGNLCCWCYFSFLVFDLVGGVFISGCDWWCFCCFLVDILLSFCVLTCRCLWGLKSKVASPPLFSYS